MAVTQAAEDGDRGDTKVQLVAAEPLLEDPPCLVLGQLGSLGPLQLPPVDGDDGLPDAAPTARTRPATIPSASSSHPTLRPRR